MSTATGTAMNTAMREAVEVAAATSPSDAVQYMPTKHAIDRAILRFGINAGQVAEWANARIKSATDRIPQGNNRLLCVTNDARILVDEIRKTIITVYTPISADFLRPTLEREKRKLRREYIRTRRQHELAYAELLQEIGEMAVNRARARNPHTRALISERLADKQRSVNEYVSEMERLDEDYKAKVRAIEVISG